MSQSKEVRLQNTNNSKKVKKSLNRNLKSSRGREEVEKKIEEEEEQFEGEAEKGFFKKIFDKKYKIVIGTFIGAALSGAFIYFVVLPSSTVGSIIRTRLGIGGTKAKAEGEETV